MFTMSRKRIAEIYKGATAVRRCQPESNDTASEDSEGRADTVP